MGRVPSVGNVRERGASNQLDETNRVCAAEQVVAVASDHEQLARQALDGRAGVTRRAPLDPHLENGGDEALEVRLGNSQ